MLAYMLRYRPQRGIFNALTVENIVKENSALQNESLCLYNSKEDKFSIRIWGMSV
jgi:hypothetical protein